MNKILVNSVQHGGGVYQTKSLQKGGQGAVIVSCPSERLLKGGLRQNKLYIMGVQNL